MIDKSFPLVDLHRHLDGSIRLETILELGLEHDLGLPADSLEGLRPFVQITETQPGVMAFLEKFEWMTKILVNPEECRRVAYENVEDALKEGIDYVELRFSPWFMAEANNLDPQAVTEAVIDGVKAGERDFGVKTNLIGIISRTYGQEVGQKELDALLLFKDDIIALDLAGDEVNFPAEMFDQHFKQAKDAGWALTVHAGESAGPDSIWKAIDVLDAKRIGHGVRAIDDPKLMDYLLEKEIGIEVNLTSNLQTSTVPDLLSHPAKKFLEHGLLVSLNTDDPGISRIDIAYEYEVAAPAASLTPELIKQAQRNGLATAFLSEDEKQELIRKKK